MKGVDSRTGRNWRFKNETGKTFGRLVVESFHGVRNNTAQWKCKCACGNIAIVDGSKLRNGHTNSCGCLRVEVSRNTFSIHGKSNTKTYACWRSMKERCYKKTHQSYRWYGQRGITVCKRWLNSFENFYADMGECPEGLTLERQNCNGNYEPANCRWATQKEQANNRRNTKRVFLFGVEQTLYQLEQEFGIPARTIRNRLYIGWPLDKALIA